MKSEKFVVINGRILDFDKYRSDFLLLKRIISADLREYFLKIGFKAVAGNNKRLLRQRIKFYNNSLDMVLTVSINKKEKLEFV